MWTKYDYVCSDCDALIEITTLDNLWDSDPICPCGSNNTINISVRDGNAPVIDITPRQVVKINTNPYN
jgi:DNA-directed RNA polymerase subunit RPC12/RpoP